jgi:hypothetical protein
MDETAWKDVQMAGKTIALKGAKSVHVVANGNPRNDTEYSISQKYVNDR